MGQARHTPPRSQESLLPLEQERNLEEGDLKVPGDHKGSGNGWINVSARRASQHKDGRGDGSAKGQ
jgi:hypothetical protein